MPWRTTPEEELRKKESEPSSGATQLAGINLHADFCASVQNIIGRNPDQGNEKLVISVSACGTFSLLRSLRGGKTEAVAVTTHGVRQFRYEELTLMFAFLPSNFD